MLTEPLPLLSTSVHLPSEIIRMIAEACIEPYSIHVGKDFEDNDHMTHFVTVLTKLPASRLAVVSRDFQDGINRGIRNNFTGHLTMPVGFITCVTRALYDRGLEWMIPETKRIHLRFWDDGWESFDEAGHYSPYINLKDITITYKRDTVYPPYFPVMGSQNNTRHPISRAKTMLTYLQDSVQGDMVSIVKLVCPVGPAGIATSCLNAEVQLSGPAPKVLMRYNTTLLEWDIRSSLSKRKNQRQSQTPRQSETAQSLQAQDQNETQQDYLYN